MILRGPVLVMLPLVVELLASNRGVQLGPSCGQTSEACFQHGSCDPATNVCVCDDFYVISGDWTKCLPVATTPYLSACEENLQCSTRMGQGAICSAGICVCNADFHYLHGICHKSSGYGEPCVQNDDCYGGFSYESLSCVENRCSCSDGYYLVGKSYCRRMGNVGEECVFDMDCQSDGNFCDENICVSVAEGNKNALFNDGNAVSIYSSEIDAEYPKTKLGDACETLEECSITTNHTECYANICVCKPGYSNFFEDCKPDLGEACSEPGDVDYMDEAECRGNILRCKAPYIITENNRVCRIGRLYGSQCQVPEQCMFSGDNAVCAAVGNRNLCQCAVGHHFVDEIQLCSVTRGIGEQCDYTYDCLVTSGNVNCAENTCSCLEGFHATRGDCTPDVEAINDPCLDTTDCTLAIPHSSCVSNKCQCNSGYFEDQTANNLCLTGISGDCTNDDDCSNVEYSLCDGSRCGCVNSTIPNADNTKCLAVATAHGGECEEDVQCHEALGQEGSSCLDGICACKDDYHFRSGSCREKRVLGEACEINSQCYLESEETDRVECRNGICQCGYIYTQTQDLDCKSGVSKLMVSFEFLAGALIWSLLERTMWN